ncbi:olfactory receptor 5P55-like [Lissotriton helveticus]
MDELVADHNEAKWFSKLDLNARYHQLELVPESSYITTFPTYVGLRRPTPWVSVPADQTWHPAEVYGEATQTQRDITKQKEMNMTNMVCSGNGTSATEFIFLGFQIPPFAKMVLFVLFLIIYIFTVAGNVLIIVTVSSNEHLHSPMYFFLVVLSLVEIGYTTSIFPILLGTLIMGKIIISFAGCLTQFVCIAFLACNESFLLTLMAYDRYVAICHPLHYSTIMSLRLRITLITSALIASVVYSFGGTFLVFTLKFSGQNEIDHFFCDFAPILKVACSDVSLAETEFFVAALIVTSIPLTLIIVSYVYIISTILQIPSDTGRQKAFSTCSSHISVVIIYFGTLIIVYGIPKSVYSLNQSKALSLLYTVATPFINPIIYTLRNKDIKESLKNLVHKKRI